MAKETFTITGVTEVQRAFKELGRKLGRKVVVQEVRKGVKVLAEDVRARAPRYAGARKDVKKGALKEDVRVRARAKIRRGAIAMDVVVGKGTKKKKGAYYGPMLEYGTRKMRARPFMRPAFDAQKERIFRMVQAGIRAGIERESKALRSRS